MTGTVSRTCLPICVTYGLWSPTVSTPCQWICKPHPPYCSDTRIPSHWQHTTIHTLTIAVRDGSHAVSRCWTSNWMLLEIMLKRHQKQYNRQVVSTDHNYSNLWNMSISEFMSICSRYWASALSCNLSWSWNSHEDQRSTSIVFKNNHLLCCIQTILSGAKNAAGPCHFICA